MISPGAIVACRQTGATAWVVEKQEPGNRWRLTSKSTSPAGGEVQHSRTAGAGDLLLIREAPSFQAGQTILLNGAKHTVVNDLGDAVEFETPDSHFKCRHQGTLLVRGGNRVTISKCDLTMESLR